MHGFASQKGFSFFGVLLFLAIGGFVLLLGFKLGPMYINNMTIQSVLNGMQDATLDGNISSSEIRYQLNKRLNINNIDIFERKGEGEEKAEVEVIQGGNAIQVITSYEVREHIIANLDVIAKFKNSVELPVR